MQADRPLGFGCGLYRTFLGLFREKLFRRDRRRRGDIVDFVVVVTKVSRVRAAIIPADNFVFGFRLVDHYAPPLARGADRHDYFAAVRRRRRAAELRPGLRELAPLLEEVAAPVCGL